MEYKRKNISEIVGQRVHDFRVMNKMSQEALALASGIHPTYLGSVERGEKCPSVETLYKISSGLGVPLSRLLDIDSGDSAEQTEAVRRINEALAVLPHDEAAILADIVEKMLDMIKPLK